MNSLNLILLYFLHVLMKVVGYGMKGLDIWISNTCNNLARKYWLMVYQTSISPKEFVRDVFMENTLNRNSTKERLKELPLLWIWSIMTSWAIFCIHQSTKRGMFLFWLMISHVSHGFTFSDKNQSSFNTSKISKPWLRHSQERKSKSSEHIIVNIMVVVGGIYPHVWAWRE